MTGEAPSQQEDQFSSEEISFRESFDKNLFSVEGEYPGERVTRKKLFEFLDEHYSSFKVFCPPE